MIFRDIRKLNLKVGDKVKHSPSGDIVVIYTIDQLSHYPYATRLGDFTEYGCYSGGYIPLTTRHRLAAIKSLICLHLIRIIPV